MASIVPQILLCNLAVDWLVLSSAVQVRNRFLNSKLPSPTPLSSVICLQQKDRINQGFLNPSLFSVEADSKLILYKSALEDLYLIINLTIKLI